jgi:hypothetical protein
MFPLNVFFNSVPDLFLVMHYALCKYWSNLLVAKSDREMDKLGTGYGDL